MGRARWASFGRTVLLSWLVACGPAVPAPETAGDVAPDSVVRHRDVDVGPGHVLLDSAVVDLTGDGRPERIELSVEAERLPDGRVLWEDGHRWLLLVREGDETAPLLDTFVPWGTAGFRILEGSDGTASVLVEIDSSTGGVYLAEYVFDAAARGYLPRWSRHAEGRVVHRTPPTAYD